jgi:hypothetical protein
MIMRKTFGLALATVLALAVAPAVRADVWDVQTDNDNGNGSDNALSHGAYQWHDAAALPGPVADEDWYQTTVPGRSSFEVVVDAVSGDMGLYVEFARVDGAGATIQDSVNVWQSGGATPFYSGYSQSLRWENTTAAPVTDFIRLRSGGCTTTCNADDVYRIRAFDTTLGIPRFNNSASQITIVQIANSAEYSANVSLHFWSTTGTHLGTSNAAIPARGLLVLNTSTLPFAAGVGGSMTVAHDAEYGRITGKAVAVEPATGFTFDTPAVSRPI